MPTGETNTMYERKAHAPVRADPTGVQDGDVAHRGARPTTSVPGEAQLTYGYNGGLPQGGFLAAWGARANIMVGPGPHRRTVEMARHFQSSAGPDREVAVLLDALNGGLNRLWMAEANRAIVDGRLRPGTQTEVVLLDADWVTVKANHEAWEGWLFVCAYTTQTLRPTHAAR